MRLMREKKTQMKKLHLASKKTVQLLTLSMKNNVLMLMAKTSILSTTIGWLTVQQPHTLQTNATLSYLINPYKKPL